MKGTGDPGWKQVKAALVGAVIAAVVMLSFPVVAAVGDDLLLGQTNTADAITSLSGTAAVNLRITNNQPSAPALDLRVTAGAPPLKVNSTGRVPNLNADRLDGKHASAFLLATGTAADAQLLDGLDSTQFSPAGHDHAGLYLGIGGQAADSSLLDGMDWTAFALTGHDHTGTYLPLGGTAANAGMLDNLDSSAFAPFFHSHEATDITAGLLSSDRFSAYGDLGAEGVLNNDNPADLLLRSQADGRFVNEGDLAADADLLDGLNSTAFASTAHNHAGTYLPAAGVAADSSLLDGMDSTAFARSGAVCPPGESPWGYGRTGPVCSGSTGQVVLDASPNVGRNPSVVLDPAGRPVVAYRDAANNDLKVLRCGNPDCSAGNTIATVDSAGDVGLRPSLVLNFLGEPLVVYADATNSDLKVVWCGNATCTDNNQYSVIVDGVPVEHSSLAMGHDGLPLVAYYDQNAGDLKLARCDNPTCASATITTVDSTGDVGWLPSLAVDRYGNPVISYADTTNLNLKLVACGNADCTAGNTFAVLDTATANQSSLVIGADNRPAVAYLYDVNGSVRLVRCGTEDCTAGNTVTTVASPGFAGFYPSLALNELGLPVIAYSDMTSFSLVVVRCGNAACTAGNLVTNLAGHGPAGGGGPQSLVLDASGHPLVAYFDGTTSSLKLAGAF
jgi:hypothetical protein